MPPSWRWRGRSATSSALSGGRHDQGPGAQEVARSDGIFAGPGSPRDRLLTPSAAQLGERHHRAAALYPARLRGARILPEADPMKTKALSGLSEAEMYVLANALYSYGLGAVEPETRKTCERLRGRLLDMIGAIMWEKRQKEKTR